MTKEQFIEKWSVMLKGGGSWMEDFIHDLDLMIKHEKDTTRRLQTLVRGPECKTDNRQPW